MNSSLAFDLRKQIASVLSSGNVSDRGGKLFNGTVRRATEPWSTRQGHEKKCTALLKEALNKSYWHQRFGFFVLWYYDRRVSFGAAWTASRLAFSRLQPFGLPKIKNKTEKKQNIVNSLCSCYICFLLNTLLSCPVIAFQTYTALFML